MLGKALSYFCFILFCLFFYLLLYLFHFFCMFICLFLYIYISGHLKPLLCELFCDSRISSWIIIFQVLSHFLSSIFGVILIDANIMVQIPSMKTGTKTSGPDQFRKISWIDLIERNINIYGRSKSHVRCKFRQCFKPHFARPAVASWGVIVKTEIIKNTLEKSLSLVVAIKLAWAVEEVVLQLCNERRSGGRGGGGGVRG